jgi:hypothetical protein
MTGTGCSRTLLAKIARRLREERAGDANNADRSAVDDTGRALD